MQLPANLDAERHLLGCLIRDGQRLPDGLLPSHFYEPKHQDIAAALVHLDTVGTTPDEVTVTSALRDSGATANHILVNDLTSSVAFSTLNPAWAETIASTARLRRIASVNLRIAQAVNDPATDPDSLLASPRANSRPSPAPLSPRPAPRGCPSASCSTSTASPTRST